MTKKGTLVLPALRPDHGLPTPDVGTWSSLGSADLDRLSEGLVASVDADYFNVDAIPDVWARPLLFEMALYQPSHPLHKKVLGEWRGLAALVALREWRGFRLGAERVVLGSAPSPFTEAADRLSPNRSLFKGTTWGDLHVFLYDGKAIGVTSPTTLLCTGVDYRASGVPWFVQGVLRAPLDPAYGGPHLNAGERRAVADWLGALKGNLTTHRQQVGAGVDPDNHWEAFLGVVGAFEDDLLRGLPPQPQGHAPAAFSRDVLDMSGQNAFRFIDEVPSPPDGDPSSSQLTLRPSVEGADAPPLIVLDRDVAEQWHTPALDIRAWGATSLEAAVPQGGMPDTDRKELGNRPIAPAEWRRPSDFFLDALSFYKNRGEQKDRAFHEGTVREVRGERAAGISMILPLKGWVLDYLTPQDLSDRVEVRKSGKGYEVLLRLPLGPEGGVARDFVVSQSFEGESLRRLDAPPVLGVWPNFRAPDWTDYFTYFERQPDGFYARPIGGYAEHWRADNDRGEPRTEIGRTGSYPEALECFDQRGDSPAGLLLLVPPPEPPRGAARWKIGVDFGTTNTTVYHAIGSGGPEPLPFEDRVRLLTAIPQDQASEYFHSWFFPNERAAPPFRTFFKPSQGGSAGTDAVVPLHGHIVYLTDRAVEQKVDLQSNVQKDLKWAENANDRVLSKLFLDQVRLQARAEAVARGASDIEWSYSVPTSFSPRQREFARNVWRGLVEGDGGPVENTESIATAAYFLRHGATPAVGTVCIDVGGMSSDVAIWQDNEVRLQTSLRLASRGILVETLEALPSLQRTLFGDALGGAEIETHLTRGGRSLWDRISAHENEPGMSLVRQSIVVGFGGVLYYTGLLLRHLAEAGRYNGRLPRVYVGGNGARMLHWLADGHFGPQSLAAGAFEHLVKAATGFEEGTFQIGVTRNEQMKHEVSFGLVSDHPLKSDATTTVLAGEKFSTSGAAHEWDAELTAEMLRSGVRAAPPLAQLRAFAEAVREYSHGKDSVVDPVDLSPSDFDHVADQVTQALSGYRNEDLRDINPEPLFATALSRLLAAMRSGTTEAYR